MSKLGQKIHYYLNQFPFIKKIIKRSYQLGTYTISKKIIYEGNIIRISPNDDQEYFFGYYDKSPWDIRDRYMLCLKVKNTDRSVAPKEDAKILLIDTQNNNVHKIIGKSSSWNIQQGCMLQWLGPDYSSRILYNDFREGRYNTVILDRKTGTERIIPFPVYTVASNGSFALSLDFSRLHRLRPGYGYSNLEETTQGDLCPDAPCIWYIDLENKKVKSLLNYKDLIDFETREDMDGAEHKVNHLMISPDGKRFMLLHRWLKGSRKYTRLLTVACDGKNMYNLSDDNMVSHCCWKNGKEILAFCSKKHGGNGYYLMQDKTQKYQRLWTELDSDGHPSYSPNGQLLITDTYPDKARIASLFYIKNDEINKIARVFAPFKYDNDIRCDLHPRWSHRNDKICFDAVFEGRRKLYMIPLQP